ncbi:MAG: GGDEF domain-containing protein, partial [Candidatus Limnocylindrales bacterium]
MLVVVGVGFGGAFAEALVHESETAQVVAINSLVIGLAIAGYWLLGQRARRQPEPIAFVVTVGVAVACALLGGTASDLAVFASTFLLLLPPLVAQLITWRTWIHVQWLLVYAVTFFGLLVVAPPAGLSTLQRIDLALLGVVSIAVSFAGHVLTFRARVRSFGQVRRIQALHRELEEQRIELAQALTALERLSRLDPLTRVANRLALGEGLERARAQVNRTAGSCGLIEADLDRFKAINDVFGHIAGDDVLRSVAKALKHALRAGDDIYRYGREEFVAILPGADSGRTAAVAERLRASVEALSIRRPGNPPFDVVTVSVGGTVLSFDDVNQTAEAVLSRADDAMYTAKSKGRNRVAMGQPVVTRSTRNQRPGPL